MREHRRGCYGFWGWALAGALLLFSILTGLSIGLFVAPLALLSLWLVARWSRPWPESLGAVTGFGAICLVIAFLNLAESDGVDWAPWLAIGLSLAAAGVLAYGAASRSSSP